MNGVLTEYRSETGEVFGSYILADTPDEAEELVKRRKLNERIVSSLMQVEQGVPDYSKLSDKEFLTRLPEIMHTCCFLSYIALKSGTMTIDEVLGDCGVLHEISHLLAGIDTCIELSVNNLRNRVIRLQNSIPGFGNNQVLQG